MRAGLFEFEYEVSAQESAQIGWAVRYRQVSKRLQAVVGVDFAGIEIATFGD